jgi:MHS family proline/betaine transporter-like MFS transporter
MLSIRLMMLGTFLIAVLPTYHSIGMLAPIGILFARLLQGFSAGGEFGSATAFLFEYSPNRRGFIASWQFASQGLSTLLASLIGVVLTSTLTSHQLGTWGWRIPFVLGLLIGPAGYYIRRYIRETPEFEGTAQDAKTRTPVRDVLVRQNGRVVLAIGVLAVSTAVNYMIIYMPTFAVKELKLPASTGFIATLVTGIVLTGVTPVMGYLSDKLGRIRIMVVSAVVVFLTIYPAFAFLVANRTLAVMVTVMFWIGLLKACYFGGLAAVMSEMFPVASRATGLSISYNIGVSVFGGFTPLIVTWLIGATGSKVAPGFYLMFIAVLSVAALLVSRWRLALR